MYTILYFRRGIKTPLMREIEAACKAAGPRKMAEYGDISVRFTPHGVACQFSQRLTELPLDMRSHPPRRVEMRVSHRHPNAVAAIYRRGQTEATVEVTYPTPCADHIAEVYGIRHIVVVGRTLSTTRRLCDDILTDAVEPQVVLWR